MSGSTSGSDSPSRSITFREDQRGFWRTYSMLLAVGLLLGGVMLVAQGDSSAGSERADRFIEAELEQTATDILRTANASGRLRTATLYWNPTATRWHDAPADPPNGTWYSSLPADHPLSQIVRTARRSTGPFAMNIAIEYQTDGGTRRQRVVYQGPPGRHAVAQSYKLVLRDGDRVIAPDGTRGCTLKALDTGACPGSYFVSDGFTGPNYAVVTVEVVLWRP